MLKLIRRIIETINGDRRLLAVILLINVMGSAFGLYYYWDQLMATPWYLWPAVPDCPLYTFFMIFVLLLIMIGKPSATLNAITAVGLSMYGTWTVIVLLYFREIYFSPDNAMMSAGLWTSHAGMALEGFLLLPYLRKAGPISWALTAAWFLVLDSVDYFYRFTYDGMQMRTHPLALLENSARRANDAGLLAKIDTLAYLTFGLTIIFFVLMIVLSRVYDKKRQKESARLKESARQSAAEYKIRT